jgi:NADH-quinone oxidoreductase subunit G
MITIYVDNQAYQAKAGGNLLEAVLSLGLNLPYFCWHPAMGSVGACRQCAVTLYKDEQDTQGKIVMACMTPVKEGLRISLQDRQSRDFRARVIEWLMANHPHDCPVCDEGGECHLQDMTVMTAHDYRRYRFAKRTFANQDLGPFVNHELNRCIACYRCVRFYNDYAGARDFSVLGCHNTVYFGRSQSGPLESEFSGNLVEVCPTGVFTDKTLKEHYTRKWDLQTAPSICVHCGLGCNTIPGERYGTLRRVQARYHSQVNGYFLCDRGRYGYEFVNRPERPRTAMIRRDGQLAAASAEAALAAARELVGSARGLAGVGSPRASLESNFALRQLVGAENFYSGQAPWLDDCVREALRQLQIGPATPSLRQVEQCDAAVVLGEDVTNFAPMLDLAIRQAVRVEPMELARQLKIDLWLDGPVRELIQDRRGPLLIASPAATKLDEIARWTYRSGPAGVVRLALATARELDASLPVPDGLDEPTARLAKEVAAALAKAKSPLVVSGCGCGSVELIQAAGVLARALAKVNSAARLSLTVPDCNSLGLAMLGGKNFRQALEALRLGRADTAVVLESDLWDLAPTDAVESALAGKRLVVLDHLPGRTVQRADVLLPAGTFAEADGTLVNNEGRAQRFFQVFPPQGDIRQSWRWLGDLAGRNWPNLDAVLAELSSALPDLAPATGAAPQANFRIEGLKVARQSHRYSGRTAITADVTVHEPKPPDDPDTPLTFSMEGFDGIPPAALVPRFWSPGWNSQSALTRFQQEVNGPLRGGPAGVRLINPGSSGGTAVSAVSGESDQAGPQAGRLCYQKLLVVPAWHIYGSEAQSMQSPALAGRAPRPYLGLSPADAAQAGLQADQRITAQFDGQSLSLEARILPSLPRGLAVLGMLAGQPAVQLPAIIDPPPKGAP